MRGDPEYDAISRLTLADIPDEPEPLVLVLRPFYRGTSRAPISSSSDLPLGVRVPPDPSSTVSGPLDFVPSSGPWISIAALATLAGLSLLGLGYAGAAFDDMICMIATAPAFGAAAVTIAAVALDRVGLRLASTPVALAASVLAGLGGLAAFLIVQRQRDREAPA